MTQINHPGSMDTDSLQADVMRFLAIIAFCLIAVMALVPGSPEETYPQKSAGNSPVQEHLGASALEAPKASLPEIHPEPVLEALNPPGSQQASTLSLRFASEQDFLSLLGKGEITLYARGAENYVQLNRDFSLSPVSLETELYELLPDSLPAKIIKVLRRQGVTEPFLVSLPNTTAREIERLSVHHEEAGGVLLINHSGQVHHERPA